MRYTELVGEKNRSKVAQNEQKKLEELTFKGSECTRDCSGHQAGYRWSQQKAGRVPNSQSPSFNKGAALQRAGK